ncbi:MAG: hypothetical protein AAB529_01685, partial [Patescibacteria group bacterium]
QPGFGMAGPKTRAKLNELYAGSGATPSTTPTPALSQDKQALIKLIKEQIAQLMAQLIQMLKEEVEKKGG